MGDSSTNMGAKYQRDKNGRSIVLPPVNHTHYPFSEKFKKIMGSKLAFIIFNALSVTGYGLIILANIGDVKAWILFVIAVLYGAARLVFYVIKSNQERRLRELDIKERQIKIRNEIYPHQ